MRKETKKRILDVVKTIFIAHDDIEKLLKKGITANAAVLIGDCQDAIISVGEIIQNSEGESHPAVSLIEDYCRDLFELYNAINDGIEYDKSCKNLNRALNNVRKCIENEILGKIEVVFMPYKASMWDSLESVWKAADADPNCDAYVVPIPYYDRKPDHSFGEFHYEGDQFPDYVPITSYKKYDERNRRPDVIYIHNPYDDCNYVTSVNPRFYSFELKKSTKCLVYIPYYVVAHERVNESMFDCSACRFVDYVILQSLPLREKYIDLYTGVLGKSRSVLKKKFIALGSPKFDAIINAKSADYSIPHQWSKLIGNKKIVLFNSSISTALNNTEEFLKKLISTIEFFSNNSEYILWWRPHPLLSSTFESMRPSLLDNYKRIVSDYIENNRGIYDDSADLQRSIILSDLYYGDFKSSVCIVYAATGKRIVSTHIDSSGDITNFEQDYIEHFRDNSDLEILKRNENYNGTAGLHIHNYIKSEVMV